MQLAERQGVTDARLAQRRRWWIAAPIARASVAGTIGILTLTDAVEVSALG